MDINTILLSIISALLTLMTVFSGSLLLSMRNFKLDIKAELSEFIKEFRPMMKEFYELKTEHKVLTGEGVHSCHDNTKHNKEG